MHRWAWLSLSVLICTLSLGLPPPVLHAQEPPAATQIKFLLPWQPDGTLNPALQVRGRESLPPPFGCQGGGAGQRPDSWRCGTADPCYAPPPFAAQTTVACATSPWSSEVVLLDLQTPLRTVEECRTPPLCRLPVDLTSPPWALELANGARCTQFRGTLPIVEAMRFLYGCAHPDGSPAGLAGGPTATDEVDRSQPLWRVFFLGEGSYVIEQVAVPVAWY